MIDSLRGLAGKLGAACALGVAALLTGPAAHAEMVGRGEALVMGPTTIDTSFSFSTSGALGVRVSDLGIPLTMADRLESLTFYVGDGFGRVLGSMDRAGLLEMWISQPGSYTLYVFATPSTRLGLMSWSADFAPSVVPLPSAIWLLMGGLGWAIGLQRKRGTLSTACRNQSVT
jgi:hypothetical protein